MYPITEKDGDYFLDDFSLFSIAKEHGTPTYVYSIDTAIEQLDTLKRCFPWTKLKIHYAVKANPNSALLSSLKENGAGIDAVSIPEIIVALSHGFDRKDIIYTSNNPTLEELRYVNNLGVLINVGSLSSLAKLASLGGMDICLRINPCNDGGENEKVMTAGKYSPFGILIDEIPKARQMAEQSNMKIIGLHEHTGSGIYPSQFMRSVKILLDIASSFEGLRFVDFGGGFKVAYKPEEEQIDYALFGNEMTNVFSGFCRNYGQELEMIFEPGKFIAAQMGILLAQATSLRENYGRKIIGLDTGFNHLIRPTLYGAYHHILNLNGKGRKKEIYDIYGNLCETGDILAAQRQLPEVREGDVLAILNAGAYGISMASPIYNLRGLPKEIAIKKGMIQVTREREDYAAIASGYLS